MKPKLLDLFCCQGGASAGYAAAGFDVYGVDLDAQPRYPYPFAQADALELLARLVRGSEVRFTRPDGTVVALTAGDFAAFHASPPCQAYTLCQRIQRNQHPQLVEPVRDAFADLGRPWVIENVEGAPLRGAVTLCGAMFGLETYRHRLFESDLTLTAPAHPVHAARTTKMGRPPTPGEFMHIVGNFSGTDRARRIMSMPWATRDGLREAIPPAYTEHVGRQLMARVEECAA